jgi:Na+-transporting NADH:ubiquinone oxidoreductase subunit C
LRSSPSYTISFAAAVCIACGLLVSLVSVSLQDRHERNAEFERRRNVLWAAGLAEPGERLEAEVVERQFERIEVVVIHLATGRPAPQVDPADVRTAGELSEAEGRAAPANLADVRRLPEHALVHEVRDADGRLDLVVLPVEGLGLWSTLRGSLALDADGTTIRGLSFHEHGETPGLGGRIDDPAWQALWRGRRAFNARGEVAVEVVKGRAGPPESDPHRVDGLSGATLTARGVSNLLHFWLGESGFGPYLDLLRQREGNS